MATAQEAVVILNKLVQKIKGRQEEIADLNAAYAGDHKLMFASDDFREFFGDRYQDFSDNWCGIVADAPHERLEPVGIRMGGSDTGDAELWKTWLRNDANVGCDLSLLDAIIARRGFALVWADEDDQAVITFEDPSQAIVEYDPETRKRVRGAKVWADDDFEYATLYLPTELWKFKRARLSAGGLILPDSFTLAFGWTERDGGVIPNPLGVVPLVELPNRPRTNAAPMSDITGALAMQHAANLLWAQLFAASDEATMGQRVVIGAERPEIPILNAEGEVVGSQPVDLKRFTRRSALWLEDPGAKIEQWQAAKLDVFTNVIEIMVGHLAAQTRTPAHYLLIGGTIANVSGDAMKTLETGLVKRTQEKIPHFGRGIRDIFELVALVEDNQEKALQIRTTGEVLWKDVENRSDAQRADALAKKREIGYPLRYVLELDGLPPQEIERVMRMVREEADDPILSQILKPKGAAPGQESESPADAGDALTSSVR